MATKTFSSRADEKALACAERAGVDFIISRDSRAFLRSPIRRLSPREYVDLFCEYAEVNL